MLAPTHYQFGSAPLGPSLALANLVDNVVASSDQPRPVLHLDGSALPYQRTLGVCHQVAQLLLLHRAGFRVRLYPIHPALHRCLHLLKVAHLFR
ncbi:hypothetical protein [Hymenobacter crusticola]|uniref:STAS domain-containing protein n=1 Tax=Hymenobacter crusticola TaxID=1770526 RepID=A0A243W708_9BACT|nr:hypothetical protein [Hymenobacter crusticola]OUJ70042.1 hypothetical protein BXP70_25565 [Hymenobacter crusticola]